MKKTSRKVRQGRKEEFFFAIFASLAFFA